MRLDGLVAEASIRALGLLTEIRGNAAVDIRAVTMDSRLVTAGALFACVRGEHRDGHDFASAAVQAGAAALLCEVPLDVEAPQVVVTSVREALGPVCDAFFGHPSRQLTVAAVTGTNGKTTTCAFLQAIFEANGWSSTAIGTLTQQRTTPEAPDLQALLASWRDTGGHAVAMEVSSHALVQHRADAVDFAAGVFTNLTPEHLDYHQTMDAYFEAKALLFRPGRVGVAVVNVTDEWGSKLADRVVQEGTELQRFSLDDVSDLTLRSDGSRFRWDGQELTIHLAGRFNVENALAAASCARALGVSPSTAAAGLATVEGVRGRFELVRAGQPFTVIVDYAHTPDGITQVLTAARELGPGKLIIVFGAGGDRDQDKRALMGAAAAELADLVVITSDNPRSEDPLKIIEQVVAGTGSRPNVIEEPDRAAAISTALATAGDDDVVVIAGKGHEQGQEIAGNVLAFDDVSVARQALTRIRHSRSGSQ